jgi:hypothetical protein
VTTTHPGWNDAIKTEVWLPLQGWDSRLQMTGEGGLVTGLLPDAMTVAECDPKDGVPDGIISAPELCSFDPFSFVGQSVPCGIFTANITYAAAYATQEAWSRATMNESDLLLGLGYGADLSGLLDTTCDDAGFCQTVPFTPLLQWLQYFLKKDPTYDWRKYTVHGLFEQTQSPTNKLYDSLLASDDVDLAPFKRRGGKMITFQGLSDQYIPINVSRTYYDEVLTLDPGTPQFYRYFQVPGIQHCGGGNGPFLSDTQAKLVDWVENGFAPTV